MKLFLKALICAAFLISGNVYAHDDSPHIEGGNNHEHAHSHDVSHAHINESENIDNTAGLIHCGANNIMNIVEQPVDIVLKLTTLRQADGTYAMFGIDTLRDTPPPKA